jgi:hypothetical protein
MKILKFLLVCLFLILQTSLCSAQDNFMVELKPLPLAYYLLPNSGGVGGDISVRLNNHYWMSVFYERNYETLDTVGGSASNVLLANIQTTIVGPKIRYYLNNEPTGWMGAVGLLHMNTHMEFNQGTTLTKDYTFNMPAVSLGYQSKIFSRMLLRIELQSSFIVGNSDRSSLPQASNLSWMSSSFIDSLRSSPTMLGLDIGIGYSF